MGQGIELAGLNGIGSDGYIHDLGKSSGVSTNHADDFDAHSYNPYERIAIGHYLWSPLFTGGGTPQAQVADVLSVMPFPIAIARTVDRVAVNVTVGAVNKVARLGIYADNGSCYPGALQVDSGEFSVADVELSTNVIDTDLTAGLYWVAFLTDGTPTISRIGDPIIIRDGVGLPSQYGGLEKAAYSYAALPATFPSGAAVGYKGCVGLLRFSA